MWNAYGLPVGWWYLGPCMQRDSLGPEVDEDPQEVGDVEVGLVSQGGSDIDVDGELQGQKLVLPHGWIKCVRRQNGRRAYGVPSRSVAGLWHLVTLEFCTCKGFRFQGRCSHLEAVIAFVNQVRGEMV